MSVDPLADILDDPDYLIDLTYAYPPDSADLGVTAWRLERLREAIRRQVPALAARLRAAERVVEAVREYRRPIEFLGPEDKHEAHHAKSAAVAAALAAYDATREAKS